MSDNSPADRAGPKQPVPGPLAAERLVPVRDQADIDRQTQAIAHAQRFKTTRFIGLLMLLALLVIVYPLVVMLDRLSIGPWRTSILPGSEAAVIAAAPIARLDIEFATRRLVVVATDGRSVAVPFLAPARSAAGSARVESFGPYVMSLGSGQPCLQRGVAGVLRALGQPSLYAPDGGTCLRLDADAYDAIMTHATRDTMVSLR